MQSFFLENAFEDVVWKKDLNMLIVSLKVTLNIIKIKQASVRICSALM